MRNRSTVTVIALLVLFGVSRASEKQPQKWYWAWRESSQTLLAYTAEGQVNRLLQGGRVDQILLGEENTALAAVLDNAHYSFYKLTSTDAKPIQANFDSKILTDTRFSIFKLTTSYWIVYTDKTNQRILIDLNKEQAKLLDHKFTAYTSISLHDKVLWFLADPDQDDTVALWNVWEYRLDTGEEHILHKQEKPLSTLKVENLKCNENPSGDQRLCWLATDPNPSARIDIWLINSNGTTIYKQIEQKDVYFITVDCVSNKSGNQWLCRSYDNVRGKFSNFHIWTMSREGKVRSLFENSDSRGYRWNALFTDDGFVVIDELCKSKCAIEVYQAGSTTPILYPLRQEYLPIYHPAAAAILKSGLLLLNDEVFLLNKDGVLKDLGRFFCCETVYTLSPDYHWIVLAGADPNTTRVWNLEEGNLEFEYSSTMVVAVDYFEQGFVISEFASPETILYLYKTRKPIKVMGNSGMGLIDLLSDDTLIMDVWGKGTLTDGIYHYDPTRGEYTLLVADAHKKNYR
jgi:hypothetical protein